jgi:acetyltransferase-like isoleucine patch superfamily enzyme/acyl carrier protein
MSARKASPGAWTMLAAAYYFRAADSVGPGAVVRGRPFVSNLGKLAIGRDFQFGSAPAPSHLVSAKGGAIEIGDRVTISYGAAISAHSRVSIGDDSSLGPYCMIMDSDFHSTDRTGAAEVAPVTIGKRVVIGSRVMILRGSSIGDGARVLGGSVVSGAIPAESVVSGVPAREVRSAAERADGDVEIPELVARVLGLTVPPALSDGPPTVPQWDSLGSLKILLALEEAFSITIPEEDMRCARTVASLIEMTARALERRAG